MSKPVLVTFPFALLLLDFWPLGGRRPVYAATLMDGTRRNASRIVLLTLEKAPLFALSIASSIVTFRAQAGVMSYAGMGSPSLFVSTAIVSCARYIGKTFWPFNLSVFYPYHMHQPMLGATLLVACGLLAITAASAAAWRRHPWLSAGWLWYLGTLVPMIGLVQVGTQSMADRYTYLPHLGIFVMLVWGLADLGRSLSRPTSAGIALAALALLATLSFTQTGRWRNTITLFTHALRVDDKNIDVRVNLGLALSKEGRFEDGNEQFRTALAISPRLKGVNMYVAVNLLHRGKPKEAARYLEEEIRYWPNNNRARNYLGGIFEQMGRLLAAE